MLLQILHVVQTLDPAFGGPARVALDLASEQARRGHQVHLVAARTAVTSLADVHPTVEGLAITELEVVWKPALYCRGLLRSTWRAVRAADVVHVHGAYRLPPTVAAWCALLNRRPLVSRPHGTYDSVLRDNVTHNVGARWLYERLLEWPVLSSKRAVVQCTSAQEEAQLLAVVPRLKNVAVVGIGVAGPPPKRATDRERAREQLGLMGDEVTLLYLGRIAQKKRLDLLLSAFSLARQEAPRLRLVIAGADPEGLRAPLSASHSQDGITWTGHVDGSDREALFQAADAFVLTSGGENFGVAAVEAAARRLPLILTREVAAADIFDDRSARFPTLDPCSISEAIVDLAKMTSAELSAMGDAAEAAWRRRATWDAVLPEVMRMYHLARGLS